MTMTAMDQYLKDRGFIVGHNYIPARKEYRFDISKNGVTKTYYWKYDMRVEDFEQYQKESMDAMLKDFNEKALINMACNSLIGSMNDGYVYNPEFDFAEFINEKLRCDYTTYFERKTNDMARIPELNNHTLEIKDVIFNDPATIVFWSDGTKTVVKAVNEDFDKEKGLAMAITKKFFGNKGNYYNRLKKWLD